MHPQVPPSFLGRSFAPELPPVNALSPEDLARMQFAARQADDQARADRIGEVMAMRAAEAGIPGVPTLEDQLLPTTSQKMKALPGMAKQQRQSLLDALRSNRTYIEGVDGSY